MKSGLKLWSVNTDFYYEEAEKLYTQGIFDYIELYVVPDTLQHLPKWRNLKIPYTIHCPHFAHGFNMAKKEKEMANFKIYSQVKKYADVLNADYIIFHGGIDGKIEETARQLAKFNETRALIENKPFRALPNKMSGEFCRGYNTDEIEEVIETSGCGFCLDFGHAICAANSQKENVYDYIHKFFKLQPKMFHLTDITDIKSEFDSHPHIGTGQLDFKKIFEMLPNESKITVETNKNNKTDLDDFVEDMKCLKNSQ